MLKEFVGEASTSLPFEVDTQSSLGEYELSWIAFLLCSDKYVQPTMMNNI